MAGLKVVIPPANEPVAPEEVLSKNKYDDPDPDTIADVGDLIVAAREWCEGYQNRAYITQTIELALDDWPCGSQIELPRPPYQSVTYLAYTDTSGNETTWGSSNYSIDDYSYVAQLVLTKNVSWPSVELPSVNGIKIKYVAGYGDTADEVPAKVKQAITLLVLHWYENGMCDPPPAVYSLLIQDRVMPV